MRGNTPRRQSPLRGRQDTIGAPFRVRGLCWPPSGTRVFSHPTPGSLAPSAQRSPGAIHVRPRRGHVLFMFAPAGGMFYSCSPPPGACSPGASSPGACSIHVRPRRGHVLRGRLLRGRLLRGRLLRGRLLRGRLLQGHVLRGRLLRGHLPHMNAAVKEHGQMVTQI